MSSNNNNHHHHQQIIDTSKVEMILFSLLSLSLCFCLSILPLLSLFLVHRIFHFIYLFVLFDFMFTYSSPLPIEWFLKQTPSLVSPFRLSNPNDLFFCFFCALRLTNNVITTSSVFMFVRLSVCSRIFSSRRCFFSLIFSLQIAQQLSCLFCLIHGERACARTIISSYFFPPCYAYCIPFN